MPKIRFKRGKEANLPVLSEGEPGFTTDSKKLFIGSATGNIEQAKQDDLDGLQVEVTDNTNRLDALKLVDANAEMLAARKLYPTLGDRLTANETSLTQKANKTEINSLTSGKADISYVDTKVATMASGSPKGTYATLTALQTAFPTGTTGTYVVTADGKLYGWINSAWTVIVQYQSTGIADDTVTDKMLKDTAINRVSEKLSGENYNLYNSAIESVNQSYYGTLVSGVIIDKNIQKIKSVVIKANSANTIKIGVGYLDGANFTVYKFVTVNAVNGINIVQTDFDLDQTKNNQLVVSGGVLFAGDSSPAYGTLTFTMSNDLLGTFPYTAAGNGILFVTLNDVRYFPSTFATARNQKIDKNSLGLAQLKIGNSFVGSNLLFNQFNPSFDLDLGLKQNPTSLYPNADMYIMDNPLASNVMGISQITVRSNDSSQYFANTIVGIGYIENGSFTVTDFVSNKFTTATDNVIDVQWFTTPNKINYVFIYGAFLYAGNAVGNNNWKVTSPTIVDNAVFSTLTYSTSKLLIGLSVTAVKNKDVKSNVVTVGKDGSFDFNDIQKAVYGVTSSASNPVTILVYPGTYVRFDAMDGQYLNIIGMDRRACIIKDTTGLRATPPVNAKFNGVIKGFTIIASHEDITNLPQGDFGSYAIHADFGTCDLTIEDCTLISYQTAAIGAGLFQDGKIKVKNCDLYTYVSRTWNTSQAGNYPALLVHGKVGSVATGQKIVVDNVHCWTQDSDYAVTLYDGFAGSQMDITIYNSTFWSVSAGKAHNVDTTKLTPDSYGNNIPALNK